MPEISKSYEPRDVEKSWYAAWLAAGCFKGRVAPDREHYSIVIPPPNVTGVLTMGHVLNNTIQDILVRRARLEGKSVVWIPGTDHAGIATQTVVERELRKQKLHRRDLGRGKFLEHVWAWREEKGGIILEQLRRLGASCDWDRTQFTMDPHYSRAVLKVFVDLFQKGNIYRGKRMVNWCPVSLTALSDEEVIMKPQKGLLYKVRYELVDSPGQFIQVATTRPETIPGDVAIAVHPDDPRYAGLIGRKVWRPLVREQIPIIADAAVDREFGAGSLKVTPAHDRVDFEIGQRHSLEVRDVLNPNGVLNDLAGPELAGMDRFAGRKKAAELLKESGNLVAEEVYENNIGFSERADVPVEPRLTWQWWLRYPRVEEAKQIVRDGIIHFHPDRWEKVYLHWLEKIQDWCISRQLWWGHRIPVWYRKGLDRDALAEADLRDPEKVHVSLDGPADPENWVQEEDVLDTWFSSWLWPFATMGWPGEAAMREQGLATFYPTSTLVTGPDIIFFWVARMIMAGLEFVDEATTSNPKFKEFAQRIPFKHVYFTGIIRDAQGRKMSKSLGNSPDPLDLIDKYGADGLRFGVISIAPQGQDIRFQEDRIEAGRNFCNKLWNASRFRQMSGPMADNSTLDAILARLEPAKFDADDHAILLGLQRLEADLVDAFAKFEFSGAVQRLYTFFWSDFCDWYVEVSKSKLQDESLKANCLAIQDLVLRQVLLLLNPFTPFITEELWHGLGYGAEGTFIQDQSPDFAKVFVSRIGELDAAAATQVDQLKGTSTQVRALKSECNLASKRDVKLSLIATDAQWAVVSGNLAGFSRLVGAAEIIRVDQSKAGPSVVTPLGTFTLGLASQVDPVAEKQRLTKELEKVRGHIAGTEARLANPAFAGKAPPAVIDGARKQLADLRDKAAEIERLIGAL